MGEAVELSLAERADRLLQEQRGGEGTRETVERRLALLAEASLILDRSLDYRVTIARAARIALPEFADACRVDLVKPDGSIECVGAAHVRPAKDAALREGVGARQPRPGGVRGRVLRSGEPLLVVKVTDRILRSAGEGEEVRRFIRAMGARSIISVPLVAGGVTRGALTFAITESNRRFTEPDLAFARQLADRAAIAMENTRLHDEERRARLAAERTADRLARVQAVTAALSSASTPAQVAGVVSDAGSSALGAEACVFAVLHDEARTLEVVRSFGLQGFVEEGTRVSLDAPVPLALAARTGLPQLYESPDAVRECFPGLDRAAPLRPGGTAAVPLRAGNRVLGAFGFCFPEGRHPRDVDRDFLLTLADLGGQALERARLLETAERMRVEANDTARRHRESEERFRTLAEMLPQQVWVYAAGGCFEYWNQRALAYLGIDAQQALRLDEDTFVARFVHPEDRPHVRAAWAKASATGEQLEVEARRRRSDGVYRWHLVRATPMRCEGGKVVRWFGTSTDVEDKRQAQAFGERLLGIVGHDLRNPLNAISVAAGLLRRGTLPPNEGDWVDRIARSARRMTRVMELLLDFTRVRHGGEVPISRERFDLRTLCREVVEELSLTNPGCKFLLKGAGDATGEWDRGRVEQVVSNLASNAVQHGDGGPVSLRIQADGDWVCLEVHNRGRPIPAAELPHLFDPYRRVGSTQLPQNLGLGLYIARQNVLAHGGRIAVRSTDREGTVFTVRLPRRSGVPT